MISDCPNLYPEINDTVEVAALKRRIAELQRENAVLRRETGLMGQELSFVPMNDLVPIPSVGTSTLLVVADWRATRDPMSGRVHVIGNARAGDELLNYQYAIDREAVISCNFAAHVLGEMHRRVIGELAKHYRAYV